VTNRESNPLLSADAFTCWNLFTRGRFQVPWHQRYYDWEQNHVLELLEDIAEAVEEERNCYFLGAIILVEIKPSKLWEINDGQQRMITLSLICAALCRRFAEEAKSSQREGHAMRVLFNLGPEGIWLLDDAESYTPRISPSQNDSNYYQMIRGKTIGTNGKLARAWEQICNFITSKNVEQCEKYFDFLTRKLELACLQVPRNVDPNSVYETINCRGKVLEDLDLIRNYFYSHFNAEDDHEKKCSVHERLERIRISIPNDTRASEYMRCHLQCIFGFLRRDSLYRDMREAVSTKAKTTKASLAENVFHLTEKVADRESLWLFSGVIAVSNPDPKFVQTFNTDCKNHNSDRSLAVFIRELIGYKVTQPLIFALLTAYLRETDGRCRKRVARIVNKNMSRLATFVLRTAFVAPKFEPSHFERKFSDFARNIMVATEVSEESFADFLRDCDRSSHNILSDSNFRRHISEVQMTGSQKIKHFLLGINSVKQNDSQILDERQCTVEHILPRSSQHWDGWAGFEGVDPKDWAHRAGNLTLLGKADNKPGTKENKSFMKKKEIFAESGFKITRGLDKYDDWTPENVRKRQSKMAQLAVRVWSFD